MKDKRCTNCQAKNCNAYSCTTVLLFDKAGNPIGRLRKTAGRVTLEARQDKSRFERMTTAHNNVLENLNAQEKSREKEKTRRQKKKSATESGSSAKVSQNRNDEEIESISDDQSSEMKDEPVHNISDLRVQRKTRAPMTVSVDLKGTSVEFTVDTGAQRSCIRRTEASRLGLKKMRDILIDTLLVPPNLI